MSFVDEEHRQAVTHWVAFLGRIGAPSPSAGERVAFYAGFRRGVAATWPTVRFWLVAALFTGAAAGVLLDRLLAS